MWVFRYFRFVRLWPEGERLSMFTFLMLLIKVPILIAQIALLVMVFAVLCYIAANTSGALYLIGRAIADARSSAKIDDSFLFVKGGEFRQAGDWRRGSKARFAEPKSGADLRRRLDELRSMRIGNPTHRTPHNGGQYGKQ